MFRYRILFWVKREDDSLSWTHVSPFQNNYSDVISVYALEGIYIGNNGKSYFSPVISTDGSFPHTWKFSKVGIKFIKASSKYTLGGSNSGKEPYSGYYASKVSSYLGFHSVNYSIRNHIRRDGKVDIVTECDCFTTEKIGTVTAHTLGLNSYEDVLEYCRRLSKKAFNTCLDMSPIFDNNYSLLPRFIEDYDTFNREDYIVRDNRTFAELYNLGKKYKSFRSELISLKKLRLLKPDNVDISNKRLKFLNNLLQLQVDYLLEN